MRLDKELNPFIEMGKATDQEIENFVLAFEYLFGKVEQDFILDDNTYLYPVEDEILAMHDLIQ
jgi:hypothetical protein